jgi:hypothetical protein
MMRLALTLVVLVLVLAATANAASSSDSVDLDILGSEADGARIISSGTGPVEVDIIGSSASNIQIGFSDENDNCTVCGACYCGECSCGYNTIWDDFTRPLCYPWSSYIPTRYNKPYHTTVLGSNVNSGTYEYKGYPAAYLGKYYQNFQ